MQNRREFLKSGVAGGVLLSALGGPFDLLAGSAREELTVLHTNDMHSHIEPFADNDKKYPGMGGAEYRSAIIKNIRSKAQNILLLDAGDIFQGTPYFNFFHGDLDIALMNSMGYDAATIGNHDFDGGIDNLSRQISNASFPFINSNYDFSGTSVESKVHKHVVIRKGGIKIGITGCGVELAGLVPDKLYAGTKYLDPIKEVQQQVNILRSQKDCDFIICLSHLGYKYEDNKVSDIVLAQQTSGIDLIIGGHTHTFLETPEKQQNKEGKLVWINQVGWAGLQIGQFDFIFEKKSRKNVANYQTVIVDKKSIEK